MDTRDHADTACKTMSDSDVLEKAKEMGQGVSRGDRHERPTQRSQPMRKVTTTGSSGPGLEQYAGLEVPRCAYLWITLQAIVIAGFFSVVLWKFLGKWIFTSYVDVYGLKKVLNMRRWIDLLCFFVFLILVGLWFGPARKLGPMYFYLPSSGGLRSLRSGLSTKVEPPKEDPSSIPTEENAKRDDATPRSGESDAEREYNRISRYYQQDESAVDATDAPEFPVSAQQYQEMSKASLLQRLADTLRHYYYVQRTVESVQSNMHSCQLSTTTGTGAGPATSAQGFNQSSAEVESIRAEYDALQARLGQATEEREAAKRQADTSEKKILKMLEEKEQNDEELQRMRSQADISAERIRKIQEQAKREMDECAEAKKEKDTYVAELIRLRGKVWTYLRLRPKINRDQENEYLDLTSPDNPNHSVVLRGGVDQRSPQDTLYEFDRIFHHTDTNRDVYEHVKPMVRAAMEEALDVAIILDGPSGSGKSYTMFEPPDGIAFLIASHIFQRRGELEGSQTEVRISNFKVYMEKVLDATIPSKNAAPLLVKEGKDTKIHVYRDSHYQSRADGKQVSSKNELDSELKRMLNARDQRETAQNATSSRGHAICKLAFSSFDSKTEKIKASSLFLVDLAGPEKYEHQSSAAAETTMITKGRGALQDSLSEMIRLHRLPGSQKKQTKLAELRRNVKAKSELTHILQDCLLGEPRILVIGTVNPYAAVEHRSRIRDTLEFATKLRNSNR